MRCLENTGVQLNMMGNVVAGVRWDRCQVWQGMIVHMSGGAQAGK